MRRIDVRVRLLALAVVLGSLFALVALSGSLSAGRIRDALDGLGVAGLLVYIVVASLLATALFPGPLLAGAAGLLFGTWLGTPVAIVSATLTAVISFTLGRTVAGDAVERLGGQRVKAIEAWVSERGFLAVLYARLAPGLPYSLVNYAAGMTRIRLLSFTAATALGTAPRTFAYVALGGSLDDLGRPEAIAAFAIIGVMAVGGLVAHRFVGRAAPSGGA